ncbi:FxsA family protein [Amaricoccus macauensis]|uniref:FxsA family protein n=1 Tax=Amaricoccus macauensis TaxID=57001 RepID=UPI003C7B22AE
MWLFLIFVAVPIIEIALFIQVGGAIGLLPTLLIVVATAIVGTALMRHQGVQALARLQSRLEAGGDPVGPIAHGALILVAGVLLLTPGFFTDATGLLLLVPAVRDRVISWGASRITVQTFSFGSTTRQQPKPGTDTIDAEYEEILEEDDTGKPRGNSGWTRPDS